MPEIEETRIFGAPAPEVEYTERRAAYVVIIGSDGRVAMVKGVSTANDQSTFLPGGGSLPGEAPEDTVTREVTEELARNVRLTGKLGEVVQYFYASSDDRHFKMLATIFAGEFTDEAHGAGNNGEHQLHWLPVREVEAASFHACHAWAVRHVVERPVKLSVSLPASGIEL